MFGVESHLLHRKEDNLRRLSVPVAIVSKVVEEDTCCVARRSLASACQQGATQGDIQVHCCRALCVRSFLQLFFLFFPDVCLCRRLFVLPFFFLFVSLRGSLLVLCFAWVVCVFQRFEKECVEREIVSSHPFCLDGSVVSVGSPCSCVDPNRRSRGVAGVSVCSRCSVRRCELAIQLVSCVLG